MSYFPVFCQIAYCWSLSRCDISSIWTHKSLWKFTFSHHTKQKHIIWILCKMRTEAGVTALGHNTQHDSTDFISLIICTWGIITQPSNLDGNSRLFHKSPFFLSGVISRRPYRDNLMWARQWSLRTFHHAELHCPKVMPHPRVLSLCLRGLKEWWSRGGTKANKMWSCQKTYSFFDRVNTVRIQSGWKATKFE